MLLLVGAQQINALQVKCNNHDHGCEWTGELGNLATHLRSCDYHLICCPNQCDNNGQITKVTKKDLDDHLTNDCPRRQYLCPHHQERGEYQEIVRKVHKCRNRSCKYKGPCRELQSHLDECDNEPVPCKYTKYGCTKTPLRRDLKRHEEKDKHDVPIHLVEQLKTDLENKIQALEDSLPALCVNGIDAACADEQGAIRTVIETKIAELRADLERQITEIPTQQLPPAPTSTAQPAATLAYSPHTCKITRYRTLQTNNEHFSSLPFYTYQRGYKVCIKMYANGNGAGEGTHVSLLAYLMKGDNDDSLSWPFTGTFTVELLNQLADKKHHSKNFRFDCDTATDEAEDEEQVEMGGIEQFLSHSKVEQLSSRWRRCQYLQDDSLIFRVSIHVNSYKPWLE